jgi:titin
MRIHSFILGIFLAAFTGGMVSAQSGGNFVIKDATLEGAGHTSSGGNFISEVRLGQGLAGRSMSGGSFAVGTGIFPAPPEPPPLTLPEPPSGLTTGPVTVSSITVTWTDTSNNEDGFLIESCKPKGKTCNFAQIAEVGPNATSFADTGLSKGTQYRYRVRAFNATGNSAYSNIASAKTLRKQR